MSRRNRSLDTSDRLEAIASTTTGALIAIDQDGAAFPWNRAAASIFGCAAEETLGQSLRGIVPKRFRAAHERGLERVNSGGEHHVIGHAAALAGRPKDGSEFPPAGSSVRSPSA